MGHVTQNVPRAHGVSVSWIFDDASRGRLRGCNSLGHVGIVKAIEDEYKIVLAHAEILQMSSLAETLTVLRDKFVALEP